jgi:phosphoribosylamine-glycine ligase
LFSGDGLRINQIASQLLRAMSNAWPESLNGKTIGFIDTNLGLDHAIATSDKLKTLYYIASGGAYPYIKDEISGDGFPGINKVTHMADATGCDYVAFLDCYFGKDADDLRKSGKPVYGPSEEWTLIENDRRYGWRRLQEMGVGVPSAKIVKGQDELLAYIKGLQDGKRVFYIKTSRHRGSKETGSGVLNRTEALVSVSQGGFGPYLDDMEFLVQDKCPGLELGLDVYFNGKDYLRPYLFTLEEKGSGTVGVWVERTAFDSLILDKVLPSLRETDYRGNISFEFFYDEKGRVYVHDPCARNGYPCSAIQAHLISNYAEVICAIASGKDARVEVDKKYAAQLGIYTDDKDSWRVIRFEDNLRPMVGFRRACVKGGDYWYVPGDFVAATAMGDGDTVEAAIDGATEVAIKIECSNTAFPGHFREDVLGKIAKLNAFPGDVRF